MKKKRWAIKINQCIIFGHENYTIFSHNARFCGNNVGNHNGNDNGWNKGFNNANNNGNNVGNDNGNDNGYN